MEKLSVNPNAFIRPSPSGGHLGGVAMKSYESLMCLEEAGYNFIFVETMGVGQAETAVHDMVDIFLVLLYLQVVTNYKVLKALLKWQI